jgi:hypothetical protein
MYDAELATRRFQGEVQLCCCAYRKQAIRRQDSDSSSLAARRPRTKPPVPLVVWRPPLARRSRIALSTRDRCRRGRLALVQHSMSSPSHCFIAASSYFLNVEFKFECRISIINTNASKPSPATSRSAIHAATCTPCNPFACQLFP